MGVTRFSDYFANFGLTEGTGIDLPGEANSIYYPANKMGIAELSSASFGQTFKVTPIQLITAASAAINGGKLMQPYVVKQVIDSQGNVVSTTEPTVKRQVISEDISKELCLMLEQVVTEGSGKQARIPGYRVGGKTGTSEKIDLENQTGKKKNILSFLGFAPVDDPQIACLVLLDEPDLINAYGSTVAAPVVGSILADVLPYVGLEPAYTQEELENVATQTRMLPS
jgi:Cell division protein FtsI/penicillin-binding protein 2